MVCLISSNEQKVVDINFKLSFGIKERGDKLENNINIRVAAAKNGRTKKGKIVQRSKKTTTIQTAILDVPVEQQLNNGNQKKVEDIKEQSQDKLIQKHKNIRKVFKLQKNLQTIRAILGYKHETQRAQRISQYITKAMSFTIAALSLGTCFLLKRFF